MSQQLEGKYFGTEINEKWWRRYTKDKMLARGNGTFSYNQKAITFLRQLTRVPIEIGFKKIRAFKTGKWHSGQWGAGRKIIKVIWENNSQLLSSGFSVAINDAEIDELVFKLNNILEEIKHPGPEGPGIGLTLKCDIDFDNSNSQQMAQPNRPDTVPEGRILLPKQIGNKKS